MLDFILRLIFSVWKFWDETPPEQKEEIKERVMEWFEDLLRAYYRHANSSMGE